jgi:hypothetical protein
MLCVVMLAAPVIAVEGNPKAEVFGGYQFTRIGAVPGINGHGWNAAVTGYVNRWLGVTGDFSGAYRNVGVVDLSAHTYTAGPTFALRGERVTPFAHVLFGGFRASTGAMGLNAGIDGFAMMTGGGMDVAITDRVAVRAFQVDWLLWRSMGATEKANVRVSAGIVFRFH